MANGCSASGYPTLQQAIPAQYQSVFEGLVADAKRNPSRGHNADLPDGTRACASWDAGFDWVYCCVYSKAYMDDLRSRELPLSDSLRYGEDNYVLREYVAA